MVITTSSGFARVALLAFVRIVTRAGMVESPLAPDTVFGYVAEWPACLPAMLLHPTARHLGVLRSLVEPTGTAGNLITDTHRAALAVEHGARLVSFDRDFGRFPGLAWLHPGDDLAAASGHGGLACAPAALASARI